MYRFIRKIERFFYWGWNLRNSYDYDYSYLYQIMYLKLDRIKKELTDNTTCSYSEENDNNIRKLSESIGILKKLKNEDFSNNFERLNMKYIGSQKSYALMNVYKELYPNAKIISTKLFSFFRKKAIEKDAKEKAYLKKRLFYILEKYSDTWWS